MTDKTLDALRLYIAGDLDFGTLENHVITFAPDATGESRILIDHIAAEIFYVWDGVSDEALFRQRMVALAGTQPALSAI